MAVDKRDLPSDPTPEDQKATREFLREGLTSGKPLKAGSVTECLPFMDEKAQHELEVIVNLLPYGHWMGSIEVYSNGFNVFVRSMYAVNATMVYRYRKD
jgi:hypothetical protein